MDLSRYISARGSTGARIPHRAPGIPSTTGGRAGLRPEPRSGSDGDGQGVGVRARSGRAELRLRDGAGNRQRLVRRARTEAVARAARREGDRVDQRVQAALQQVVAARILGARGRDAGRRGALRAAVGDGRVAGRVRGDRGIDAAGRVGERQGLARGLGELAQAVDGGRGGDVVGASGGTGDAAGAEGDECASEGFDFHETSPVDERERARRGQGAIVTTSVSVYVPAAALWNWAGRMVPATATVLLVLPAPKPSPAPPPVRVAV